MLDMEGVGSRSKRLALTLQVSSILSIDFFEAWLADISSQRSRLGGYGFGEIFLLIFLPGVIF
jgi:hypothetical protein